MSKFYLRAATNNVGSHTRDELSTALPVGTFDDSGNVARDLETTAGSSQVNTSNTSLAQTTHQDQYLGKFISDALVATAVDANTWTIALATSESNANANSFTVLSIYVLQSDDTVRGYVYDSDTPLGVEYATSEDGQVFTISGSAVASVASTDRLAVEIWVHAEQGSAMALTNTLFFDGATDVTDSTTTDAASFISTPQDLFSAGGATVDPYPYVGGGYYPTEG